MNKAIIIVNVLSLQRDKEHDHFQQHILFENKIVLVFLVQDIKCIKSKQICNLHIKILIKL